MNSLKKIISPTGKGIRTRDKWGSGFYNSSRDAGLRLHKGIDLICYPGQDIIMPISGLIVREAKPYSNKDFSGCLIRASWIEIKMFYFNLNKDLLNKWVAEGKPIGTAQDISKEYPGITSHIHLEIVSIDPSLLGNFTVENF